MNEKELAEVREKIARVSCDLVADTYSKDRDFTWEQIGTNERNWFMAVADQILDHRFTKEGGVCPECFGTGTKQFRSLLARLGRGDLTVDDIDKAEKNCPECKGTGKVDKTFTIKEAIERMYET